MLQDLQRIRKHNLAVVVNYFLKVQTEKSLIFFLNYLIWVLTNTFRFSCVLHYSCWKISHFLFFLSFLFRMILLVFLMWLSLKNDFLVQFLLYASLVSIFCFSVGNFRQILILFWCQFFFRASPIFFLSFFEFIPKFLVYVEAFTCHYIFNAFIRIFEDLMLLSQVPFSRLFLKSKASSIS